MDTNNGSAADRAAGVVVIGRNEGERLVACLRSLAPLGLPVTYVDSASSDGSRDRAREAGAEVVELDLALPFTAARARNEGATALLRREPRLCYIHFIDGDCSLVEGWMPTAIAALDARPELVAVCGQRAERFPDRSIYNRLCDEEWNTPVGEALACGGDALMRVEAFTAVGGFDPSMVAHEEPELCARLHARGGKIARLDAPMTLHDANITRFGQWWRRNVRAGFGYAQAFVRAPGLRSAEAGLLRRAFTWTAVVVLAALLGLLGWPVMGAALLLLYPLQIARLAQRRRRAGRSFVWRAAMLEVASKFAEASGALRYAVDALLGRRRGAILYR